MWLSKHIALQVSFAPMVVGSWLICTTSSWVLVAWVCVDEFIDNVVVAMRGSVLYYGAAILLDSSHAYHYCYVCCVPPQD